jgi:hypothetical protein
MSASLSDKNSTSPKHERLLVGARSGRSYAYDRMCDLIILDERVVAEAGKTAHDFLKQDGRRPQQQ